MVQDKAKYELVTRLMVKHGISVDSNWFFDHTIGRPVLVARRIDPKNDQNLQAFTFSISGDLISSGTHPLSSFFSELRADDESAKARNDPEWNSDSLFPDQLARCHRMLDLKPGLHVAEIGPGNSKFHLKLAQIAGKVTLIDHSKAILDGVPNHPKVEKILGDANGLKGESIYDRVFTSRVLARLPSPVGALRNIRNSLRPGGVYVAFESQGLPELLERQAHAAGFSEVFVRTAHTGDYIGYFLKARRALK